MFCRDERPDIDQSGILREEDYIKRRGLALVILSIETVITVTLGTRKAHSRDLPNACSQRPQHPKTLASPDIPTLSRLPVLSRTNPPHLSPFICAPFAVAVSTNVWSCRGAAIA